MASQHADTHLFQSGLGQVLHHMCMYARPRAGTKQCRSAGPGSSNLEFTEIVQKQMTFSETDKKNSK